MRKWIVTLSVLALAAAAATGYFVFRPRAGSPTGEVRAYLAAWSRGDVAAMRALVAAPPAGFDEVHEQLRDGLRVAEARYTAGEITRDGDRATARYGAVLTLRGLGEWRYDGSLVLDRSGGEWRVAWTPAAVHPELSDGRRFGRRRTWPERAPILDRNGAVLAGAAEVVSVGVEPRRITDRAQVHAAAKQYLGLDAAAVDRALGRPGVQPDHFVPLADLRPDRYERLRPRLVPVPGIVFRRRTARLSPSDGFARHVLGRVTEATAERLEQLGPLYQAGDAAGAGGLEGALESRLAGRPSGAVVLRDAAGDEVATLHEFAGAEPEPVRTTLDAAVQQAAERAVPAGVRGALVAVDTGTGEIRAVVSRPLDEEFNRGLAGRYPPGSTFKIVTTAGLLTSGLEAGDPTDCPERVLVGGKAFRNFESSALGRVPFRESFAQSCNTAFVKLTEGLGAGKLGAAARSFGFGAGYDVGLRTTGGSFPEPRDTAELAAAGIGQGRVEASPLHVATIAAAVASGAWRPPPPLVLGRSPGSPSPGAGPAGSGSPGSGSPGGAASPGVGEVPALAAGVVPALRELMAAVVTSGSAAGAGLPAGTRGKTGTAEFGTADPPETHAWFTGHRGSLAVAVLIEGGAAGGRVAAPVAARFLAALPA